MKIGKTKVISLNQLEGRMQFFDAASFIAFSKTRKALDGTRTNVSVWKIHIMSSLFR